jgi:hypothetical protein
VEVRTTCKHDGEETPPEVEKMLQYIEHPWRRAG